MASIPVIIKHQGKKYDVELDPTSTGEVLKFQVYSLTGVEPERQKILVKGGQLKDDTDLGKIGAKPGQTFMMMGTPSGDAGEIIRPQVATKFVEDMTAAEAAQQVGATPAGLANMGNTCYLNSTLQTLRLIPELQDQLQTYVPEGGSSSSGSADLLSQFGLQDLGGSMDLTAALRDLYKRMSETQEGYPPIHFIAALRASFPQFAEKSKDGRGFAQQDAEEAWSQILHRLKTQLKVNEGATSSGKVSFVDKYLSGRFVSVTTCDEKAAVEAGEEPTKDEDVFLKLNCHISANTNHLRDGLLAALEEQVEKRSPVLERDAVYTKRSKISRLPKYLTVHFVRFFWKREAQKAKIMRKVTFPRELDVVEFCTDELKKILIPVRDKVREVRKDEEDFQRARKRQKRAHQKAEEEKALGITDNALAKANEKKAGKKDDAKDQDNKMEDVVYKTDAEVESERAAALLTARKELHALIDSNLAQDDGANASGLYELRGVVTHQGASADSGHYMSYVKKTAHIDSQTGKPGEEDGKWWWFNDDKVTEVDGDRIDTLCGGGESASALILLYKAIPLPAADGS